MKGYGHLEIVEFLHLNRKEVIALDRKHRFHRVDLPYPCMTGLHTLGDGDCSRQWPSSWYYRVIGNANVDFY